MEYFILEEDSNYVMPSPLNWRGKLDSRILDNKRPHDFPKHMILFTEDNMQMVFTDIVTFPCFMVSKTVMDTILLYDPFIQFQRIILLSRERKRSEAYYIPFLPKVECLMEGSILNQDKSVVKQAKIEIGKLTGKTIVRVDGLNSICVLIRMDLAESILRRETVGIGLRETQCI